MIDFIQGQKFVKLADWTYSPPTKKEDDYDNLPNTLDLQRLKNRDIIYTHTSYAKELFNVIEGISQKVKVITHNSDVNIDFSPPDCVFKWFSQNVNVFHDRLESIPIGLENDRWFPELRKKEKMLAKLQEPRKYKNLVYMNHNAGTNPTKREFLYDLFRDKPWVTIDRGVNGKGFDEYIDNVYNHKFVICPQGNGLDTHRRWETLYMGSIPIEIKQQDSLDYWALSFFRVKDWGEVTEESLNTYFKDFEYKSMIHLWNTKMLTFEWWKNKILNA